MGLNTIHFVMGKVYLVFSLLSLTRVRSQLLGAGTGVGSCRAFPYRVEEVDWEVCPQETACCNEYGYCRTEEEWSNLQFRDCNGQSNGIDLPESVLRQESALGGVAGEGLGAEKTFDISQVGEGVYGPGGFSGSSVGARQNQLSGSSFGGSGSNRVSSSGFGIGSNRGAANGIGSNIGSANDSNRGSAKGSNRGSANGSNRGRKTGSNGLGKGAKGSAQRGNKRGSGDGSSRFSGNGSKKGFNQGNRSSSRSGGKVGSSSSSRRGGSTSLKNRNFGSNEIGGSGFPLVGYENTAGFPMNLNSENCPKYPFCWWNPYQNKN